MSLCSLYTYTRCPNKREATIFLSYLLQNSADCDKIWCIVFWINFPQRSVNVFISSEESLHYEGLNVLSRCIFNCSQTHNNNITPDIRIAFPCHRVTICWKRSSFWSILYVYKLLSSAVDINVYYEVYMAMSLNNHYHWNTVNLLILSFITRIFTTHKLM